VGTGSKQKPCRDLNNLRCEASRHFRNKKKAYLKAKTEELETNSKIKNIMDERGDLVSNSHSILARWRNYFSQLLNVHGVNDVRQRELHTTEQLVPEPSVFEFALATEN